MSKIYNMILRLLTQWTVVPCRTTDEWPGFSAHDWADLPAYHPLTDEGRTC